MTKQLIKLDEKQEIVRTQMVEMVLKIETHINKGYKPEDIHSCIDTLAQATQLLAMTPKIMEYAKTIHDFALGQAGILMMSNPVAMDAKFGIQKNYMAGMIAKYSGMYERADTARKSLDKYIDGLRTVISAEKTLMDKVG